MPNEKVAVITGASKGIGRACAVLFLENGYTVVDASRTNPHPILSDNFHYEKTDVSKEKDIEQLFDTVAGKFERIDVLINNAGYGKFMPMNESSTEDFDNMFAVNVRGLYLCSRYALHMMLNQNSGTIINIASLAGKNGFAGGTLYAATKHAVMGMTKSLMLEVRSKGVRVSAVCPGSVDTEFFENAGTESSVKKTSMLTPEDIAKACLLIAELPPNANMSEVDLRPANPH